ncbi:MAG: TrkH family potassium uptake protein [Gaiellaceae bacterium]
MSRRRRPVVGVEVDAALYVVGRLILLLALALLVPAALAVGYDESPWPFVLAAAITAAGGLALTLPFRGSGPIGAREGFLVIVLLWLLAAAAGMLPYLLADEAQLSRPLDAYFESMSGFSGTSASVVTDVEGLSRSIAMWRQLTAWIGGLGIIVLGLAVLPRLRVGGRQLFQLDAPGPELEPLTVTIRESARRFVVLYVGLTALEVLALSTLRWFGSERAMGLFDAVSYSFGTLATAGFAPHNRSMEGFGAPTQWTVVVFMALAGTNFALLYASLLKRRPRPDAIVRDEEFRLYGVLLAVGSALLVVELVTEDLVGGASAVRHGVFQAVSTMTTTGFATADYARWTGLTSVVIVGLMFFGASAGSTSGSLNVVRHLLIGKLLRRELDQTVHPELITPIRLNGRVVDERSLRGVYAFVLLYVGVFALGALLIMLDGARTDIPLRPLDAIAASATTIGNVGPGLGIAGPMGSFAEYGDPSKLVMIALMWLGRLEIIPIAVLLTRAYWRA